ncbi:MAG: NAD(P)H-dependent oxidoreductase [Nitrospira sp.]|nr:NAD(P)H-dependent oxidoreductase [bacterium]MBL7048522.1 NAD(P)H-dependent oxidoreductase [Nitrospira sp.]
MNEFKKNVLIIFAHPALQKSRVNSKLIKYVNDMQGVTFHDLYEIYPDFHINVAKEQAQLLKHDIIVFHHPLFWFSVPALLKEWMDLVLEHMWAYGRKGSALKGKKLLSVITTGGRESLFSEKAYNRHPVKEFLYPVAQTAYICGMDYLPPFVVHGTHTITQEMIAAHGEDYKEIITALRDDTIDLEKAAEMPRLNSDMNDVLKGRKL